MLNGMRLAQMPAESVGAGPIGLLLLVLIGIATAALIRSMNGRLKRLPSSFAPAPTEDPELREEKPDDGLGS